MCNQTPRHSSTKYIHYRNKVLQKLENTTRILKVRHWSRNKITQHLLAYMCRWCRMYANSYARRIPMIKQCHSSGENMLSILNSYEYLGSRKLCHSQRVAFQSHITRAITFMYLECDCFLCSFKQTTNLSPFKFWNQFTCGSLAENPQKFRFLQKCELCLDETPLWSSLDHQEVNFSFCWYGIMHNDDSQNRTLVEHRQAFIHYYGLHQVRPNEDHSNGWKLACVQPKFCFENHHCVLYQKVSKYIYLLDKIILDSFLR